MEIACLDLEGVLIPEIWIDFAERTGIEALKATTARPVLRKTSNHRVAISLGTKSTLFSTNTKRLPGARLTADSTLEDRLPAGSRASSTSNTTSEASTTLASSLA